MIRNILFDLDGTLLPMEPEHFIKLYFEALCKRFCKPLALEPEKLIQGIWKGTEAMFHNDGSTLNKEKFWEQFSKQCGEHVLSYEKDFDDFYSSDFYHAKQSTKENPLAKPCVESLLEKGYRVILATNPAFPIAATASRVRWAGLEPDLFEYITVYDNSSFCKPNEKYYEEILAKRSLRKEECVMIGNDVREDMAANHMGIDTYLVTDYLENKNNEDYSGFRQGSFSDLCAYLKEMPAV